MRARLRLVTDLLISLNIALVVVLGVVLGDGVCVPFADLAGAVNTRLGLKPLDFCGGYLVFFACVSLLTFCLWVLMLWAHRSPVLEGALAYGGGLVAICASPVAWFWTKHQYHWYPAEVAIYACLAILWTRKRWTLPTPVTALIVGFHCGFWYLQFWAYGSEPIGLSLPILGFCTCLVWGAYVNSTGSPKLSNEE
jgi:hypothetical protein